MGWHGEIGRRLRALWHRDRIADELDEEMRLHVALRRERLERTETATDAADLTARRRFGDPLRLREDAMDAWGWRWLEQAAQDVRFATRTLIANPGFTLAAVGTLALGIGANTTVFSVVSAAIVRPLPFADPESARPDLRDEPPGAARWPALERRGVQAPEPVPRGSGRVGGHGALPHAARWPRTGHGGAGGAGFLLNSRCAATSGPHLPPRRPDDGGGRRRELLEGTDGRASLDRRQRDPARRSALHDHRRHAGVVSIPLPRRLDPDRGGGRGAHRRLASAGTAPARAHGAGGWTTAPRRRPRFRPERTDGDREAAGRGKS